MKRMVLRGLVCSLMVLSLLIAACGQTTSAPPQTSKTTQTTQTTATQGTTQTTETSKTTTTVSSAVPKYGGTLNICRRTDPLHFDPTEQTGQTNGNEGQDIVLEPLWEGDWAQGPAGGFGANKLSFIDDNDIWDIKTGITAENTKWTYNFEKNEGIIVYTIRQGMYYGLNTNLEASRLVNGRQLTADDVVAHFQRMTTQPLAYVYTAQPELRTANITKTGPWEVTVKLPVDSLVTGITRFGQSKVAPPEVVKRYTNTRDWKTSIGTGPYMFYDYIPASVIEYNRNPKYWMKDPVGPGKGNQLPYTDKVKFFIIPDSSTRQAAFRTGKIDQMDSSLALLNTDEIKALMKGAPALKSVPAQRIGAPWTVMRTDKAPFTDVKVRRAMFMALDLTLIVKNMYAGEDMQINTWPWPKIKGYEPMYLGLDDPDCPASVKELYTYNPDKAKQLLKEAGFPNGFKTNVLTSSEYVDYYSVVKDSLLKIGVDMTIKVEEPNARTNIILNRQFDQMEGPGTHNPFAVWYTATMFSNAALQNAAQINDPFINDSVIKIRRTILTDGQTAAEKQWRELMKYVLDQAYNIPGVSCAGARIWWPWVKNYSGETGMSYYVFNWPQFVWLDQDLKKSMGY
jgi:peptide/nickel transport system substrate-binding protein